MADDEFHEIQLSGKQLVFVFMATTVVSVVIFLCGVLVGRGVRDAETPPLGMLDVVGEADPMREEMTTPVDPPFDVGTTETVDAAAELSYYGRLQGETPVAERLQFAPEAPPVVTTSTGADRAPAADGFTVQVTALRGRADADAIRAQLSDKGYPAYVVEPDPGAPVAVYRVRVGRYLDRTEAESIRQRLEEEEQFKPWITR